MMSWHKMGGTELRESSALDVMGGHEFEDLIAKLMNKMGFVVHERKLTCDGGVDILAENVEPMMRGLYVVQCKRHSKKVDEHTIRDLYGVVHARNANKGILITNSQFTDAALKFALNKQLELIDGENLCSLLVKYNIGNLNATGVVLPKSSRFLMNTFAPALLKICRDVDDAKNGLSYIEKKRYPTKQWLRLLQSKLSNIGDYSQFVTLTVNQCFDRISIQHDNFDQVKDYSLKIVDATTRLANDLKEVIGIIPPNGFESVHSAFVNLYTPTFSSLRKFANDIVDATVNAQRKSYDISLLFSIDAEVEAFNHEMAKATRNLSRHYVPIK